MRDEEMIEKIKDGIEIGKKLIKEYKEIVKPVK
jgi:hypothetical protein